MELHTAILEKPSTCDAVFLDIDDDSKFDNDVMESHVSC